ncbi:23S rRNA (guanosine(2251)-2'-O)-methyltransferase RlmB [Intrasporangium sp.]|uniref:23S rRNA (guanosine(2251)-2'-O)-methyltransferase RlmB n=1 Tax=Intrasporangium sp. TaxID=1925024 RepID=UPI00293A9A72|nr:23S rRNA (guanosine(2251)-2'-O)-methyltransferase RlmB [Intrasporangium sp.]MDV3223118.1 23S rRNA (guanosine(2251)-2'-O)-methyltransferase RlmB [Intrasporangium sp.]
MPGNSQRRGAVRKGGKKSTVGSGGQRRRGLEGKGPTPKAVDREYHPAHKKARTAAKRGTAGGPRGSGPAGRQQRRSKGSSEIVAGRNSVVEALRADIPVSTMYVASRIDSDDRVKEALKLATERGLAILETPRGELDRLTDGAVHQGLALQVPPYDYADPRDLVDPEQPGIPLVVALDGITDPRNLGAIIRSVAAFGGHGVVVPERRSVGMTASAWKTSAGAAARVPVAKASNLTRALEDFKKAGFFILGLDMDGDVELPDLSLAEEPLVIVTGSEGKGLSRLVRETCDQIVSIPMSSAVESLNAGLATGVALYEISRQRRP